MITTLFNVPGLFNFFFFFYNSVALSSLNFNTISLLFWECSKYSDNNWHDWRLHVLIFHPPTYHIICLFTFFQIFCVVSYTKDISITYYVFCCFFFFVVVVYFVYFIIPNAVIYPGFRDPFESQSHRGFSVTFSWTDTNKCIYN